MKTCVVSFRDDQNKRPGRERASFPRRVRHKAAAVENAAQQAEETETKLVIINVKHFGWRPGFHGSDERKDMGFRTESHSFRGSRMQQHVLPCLLSALKLATVQRASARARF